MTFVIVFLFGCVLGYFAGRSDSDNGRRTRAGY